MDDYKYGYCSDGDGGAFRVNLRTGEITGTGVAFFGPEGSIMLTPAQQTVRKHYGEQLKEQHRKEMEALRKELSGKMRRKESADHFVFQQCNSDLWKQISPENVARSVFLGTFTQYDGALLQLSERTPMRLKDLEDVLQVSKSTRKRFWSEVRDVIFTTDQENRVYVKNNLFVRGGLSSLSPSLEYERVYIEALRELYQKAGVTRHSRLGFVFQMLPYLNFEYNVLCHNPEEKQYDRVRPLSVSDFCDIIHFDRRRAFSLVAEYNQIHFSVDGREEKFCRFLGDGKNVVGAHIYVNPRIVYKGKDFQKVEAVGISFAADANKI